MQVRQPDGSLQPRDAHALLDPVRPGVQLDRGHPAAVDDRRRRSRSATPTPTTSAIVQHVLRLRPRPARSPQMLAILKRYEGIPWVNTIAADKQGNALYADIGAIPNVPDSLRGELRHRARRGDIQAARPAGPRRVALGLQLGHRPDAVVPGIFGPEPPAAPAPLRLRHQLQRQLLAVEPAPAADRVRPDHRRRGHGAHAADPDRADHDPGPGRRQRRARAGRVHPAGHGEHGVLRPPVRRRAAGATSWWRLCRGLPGGARADELRRHRSRSATPATCSPHWDLHENLDSTAPSCSAGSSTTRCADRGLSPFSHPFNANDPVHTPDGAQHRRPRGPDRARRRDPGPRRRPHPARRRPRTNVQAVKRHGPRIPIHGGVGDPNGEFNAIYAPSSPARATADVTSARRSSRRSPGTTARARSARRS